MFLAACGKEATTSSPLQLTGAYRCEGATLASRLAASRNSEHSLAGAAVRNKDDRKTAHRSSAERERHCFTAHPR